MSNNILTELTKHLQSSYDDNLNYYNKLSYLLTFVDKVPIDKYTHCDPMVNVKEDVKNYIKINDKIWKIHPSISNLTDSFLTSLFNQFNTSFTTADFFLRFKDFKNAFYNDLKINLPKRNKKLLPYIEKNMINFELLNYIAKYYNIKIMIFNEKGDILETHESIDDKYCLKLIKINRRYHRLTQVPDNN